MDQSKKVSKPPFNAAKAGLAGLVIGAAAGATAAALSDPKVRQKAAGEAQKLQHQAKKAYRQATDAMQQARKGVNSSAETKIDQAEQMVENIPNPPEIS